MARDGQIEFFLACEMAVEVCAAQPRLVRDLTRERVGTVLLDRAERGFNDLSAT